MGFTAEAWFLIAASAIPLIKIIGHFRPSADNWWANSTPVMSPRFISMTRQQALQVEAQMRNVSAES